jgi:hypothetical protein
MDERLAGIKNVIVFIGLAAIDDVLIPSTEPNPL